MNIDQFKSMVDKKFGQGSLMELGDSNQSMLQLETMTTGLPSLDFILGNNGLARGRIVEIFGGESGGKTSLTSFILSQAQRNAGKQPFVTSGIETAEPKPIAGRVANAL